MSKPKIVSVDEIIPGPIQHNELPELWYKEVISIYSIISEVLGSSFDKFEENFRRDLFYQKEITLWRCIATTYHNFISARLIISLSEKKAAFEIALMCSMNFNEESEVTGNEIISEDDARFIYRTYHTMISQTYKNRRNEK
jgi:hypothetical protein